MLFRRTAPPLDAGNATVHVLWVTSATDRVEHRVFDHVLEQFLGRHHDGVLVALCGERIPRLSALSTPPARQCRRCTEAVAAARKATSRPRRAWWRSWPSTNHYDHIQQIALTLDGRRLTDIVGADPSADSVSDLDGHEGQNEDWKYDFCPDSPGSPA